MADLETKYVGITIPLALRRLKNGRFKFTQRCLRELKAAGWSKNKDKNLLTRKSE